MHHGPASESRRQTHVDDVVSTPSPEVDGHVRPDKRDQLEHAESLLAEQARKIDSLFRKRLISAAERDALARRAEKGENLGVTVMLMCGRCIPPPSPTRSRHSSNSGHTHTHTSCGNAGPTPIRGLNRRLRTGIVDVGVQPDPAAQGQISSHREANRVSTHVEYKPEETGRNRRRTENISARVVRNHGTSNSEVGVDRRGAAATVAPLLADASQVIRTAARYCGNFLREDGEECDDGNIEMFDGCSHNCKVEPGWRCRPPRNKIPGKEGGDECREEAPEEVLYVVQIVGSSTLASGLLAYDGHLCLADCEHCRSNYHLDRECHQYCYPGLADGLQKCETLGVDCRDRAGNQIRQTCVLKESDAIARCAVHPHCTAVVCFLHPASPMLSTALHDTSGRPQTLLQHERLCLAYNVSLEEAKSHLLPETLPPRKNWFDVLRMCDGAACTTRFLLPAKSSHKRYMLAENERTRTQHSIQDLNDRIKATIVQRESVQHSLNLIGLGGAAGHGKEYEKARAIKDLMDMEERLVDERQQLLITLQIPFRAQTVVSPLTPQLWKLFAEKRRTLQLRDP